MVPYSEFKMIKNKTDGYIQFLMIALAKWENFIQEKPRVYRNMDAIMILFKLQRIKLLVAYYTNMHSDNTTSNYSDHWTRRRRTLVVGGRRSCVRPKAATFPVII